MSEINRTVCWSRQDGSVTTKVFATIYSITIPDRAFASNPRVLCSYPWSPEPLPASTVSLRSWLAAVCGNSFSLRELRLRTPLLDASSSARSKPRLGGRLELLTCVGIDGGEQSRHRMGRVDSGPKLDIMASLSTGLRVCLC